MQWCQADQSLSTEPASLYEHFLPGKVEGRPVQFLIDTGCTTDLLCKQVFDKLSSAARSLLEESDSHSLMADGTRLTFYGVVHLPLQLKDVKNEEVFVVSKINENALLEMPILVAHQ